MTARNLLVDDLDTMARQGLKTGKCKTLTGDLYIMPGCHPASGVKIGRTYEGDAIKLTCMACGKFVCNIKVAKE